MVGFSFLGVNTQLDLQTFFTAFMRCVARANGWYAERRQYQHLFLVGLVLGVSVLLASAWIYFRRIIHLVAPALLGAALTGAFVIVRAASFHHEAEWIGIALPSAGNVYVLVELLGIFLVALNAMTLLGRGNN